MLPNSPLTEVVCEFRFHGELSLLASWGDIQKAYRQAFPKLYVPGAAVGTSPLLQAMQLVSAEEDRTVRLAVNSVAFSTSRYTNWESFLEEATALLETFRSFCPVAQYTRVGLRYVNLLPPTFPGPISPGRVHPCLKLRVDGLGAEFAEQGQVAVAVQYKDVILRAQLVTPQQGKRLPKPVAFAPQPGVHFDLDGFKEGEIPAAQAMDVIKQAHEAIDEAFFGLITDEYRLYLEGR